MIDMFYSIKSLSISISSIPLIRHLWSAYKETGEKTYD